MNGCWFSALSALQVLSSWIMHRGGFVCRAWCCTHRPDAPATFLYAYAHMWHLWVVVPLHSALSLWQCLSITFISQTCCHHGMLVLLRVVVVPPAACLSFLSHICCNHGMLVLCVVVISPDCMSAEPCSWWDVACGWRWGKCVSIWLSDRCTCFCRRMHVSRDMCPMAVSWWNDEPASLSLDTVSQHTPLGVVLCLAVHGMLECC